MSIINYIYYATALNGCEGQKKMEIKYYFWPFFIMVCCLCSPAFPGTPEIIARSKPLLHTFVEIKAWGNNADSTIEEAFSEMERVNSLLNTYDPGSDVSHINQQAGGAPVPVEPGNDGGA